MSFVKAAKWLVIYTILTLGFAAIAALVTYIWVGVTLGDYEFEKGFFFSLFLEGIALVAVGFLAILHAPRLTWADIGDWPAEAYRRSHAVRSETKEGILLILVGLTLFLAWLTHYLLVGGY